MSARTIMYAKNPPPLDADPSALNRLKFPPGLRFGAISAAQRVQFVHLMNAVASLLVAASTYPAGSAAHRKLQNVADSLEHHRQLNPYPPTAQKADQRNRHFELGVPFEVKNNILTLAYPKAAATTLQHYFYPRQWPEYAGRPPAQLLLQVLEAMAQARPGPHTFLSREPARWLNTEREQRAAESLAWHLAYGQYRASLPGTVQLS